MARAKQTKQVRKDKEGKVLKNREYQRENGLYEYKYRIEGQKGYSSVYADNLTELRTLEKKIEKDISDGINTHKGKSITLNDMFDKMMRLKVDIRESTKNNYIARWNDRIRENLGKKHISTIKKSDIDEFFLSMRIEGLHKGTCKLYYYLIYQCFEMALDDDLIRKNPAKKVVYDGEEKEVKPLTEKEQESLLEYLERDNVYHQYLPLLVIFLGTGLRVSELCALTWQDIDFENKRINVDKQLLKRKTKSEDGEYSLYVEKPKTKSGIRSVSMDDDVVAAFLKQKEQNQIMGKKIIKLVDGYGNFIFITKNGLPYCVTNVNFILRNIVKNHNKEMETELPYFSAHVLRHTYITEMYKKGVDGITIKKQVGHSTDKKKDVTLGYIHPDEDFHNEQLKKAEGIIGRKIAWG